MDTDTQRLAETFSAAADKVADGDSFVAMKKLVELFGAEFRAQPLLYEGLVAEPRTPDGKWVVLVDSHSSGFTSARYDQETCAEALPPRLRFTIAHELGHVVQLQTRNGATASRKGKRMSAVTLQNGLEREADALSPLLLIPPRAFEILCAERKESINLANVLDARKRWAVSREVLVHRFALLTKFDPHGFRFRPALANIAIGLVERTANRSDVVAAWPHPFTNFSENLLPEFLQRAAVAKQSLCDFFRAPECTLNGGSRNWDESEVYFGTAVNPRAERWRVRLTLEEQKPVVGAKSLFILQRV